MGVHREYQPDLAIVLQRSQGTVSNKLTGRSAFTVDELDKLADHYGITTADLLSGVEVAVTKSLAAKAKGGSALPG